MSNPLFNSLGGNSAPTLPAPLGNIAQVAQQFRQFKANFQGDPKQEVERLLQSGQMTQSQLDQLQAMARMIQPYLN